MFHAIISRIKKYFFNQSIFIASNPGQSKFFFNKISRFNRVLLITGKASYKTSGSKLLMDEILKDQEVNIFNNFDVNPDVDQIKFGYQIAKKNKPNIIIAIGGGSVIDAAKIIHYMYCNDLDEEEIFHTNNHQSSKSQKYIPLVAIPTTAGTGSESTHFAVLYKNKKKFSIVSREMLPSMVYLDQNLCLSNSSYQNACSGFDALAQAIESYWSKSSSMLSRYYTKKAINLILDSFSQVNLNSNKDMLKILIASNYAGKAINLTKTTAPHAISYGITQTLGLPHGHAVAITLGAFFSFHNQEIKKNNAKINKQLKNFRNVEQLIYKKSGTNPSDYLYQLMLNFALEYDLNKLGLDEDMIEGLIENVNLERLLNHPIKLDANKIKNVFHLIPIKN